MLLLCFVFVLNAVLPANCLKSVRSLGLRFSFVCLVHCEQSLEREGTVFTCLRVK